MKVKELILIDGNGKSVSLGLVTVIDTEHQTFICDNIQTSENFEITAQMMEEKYKVFNELYKEALKKE